MSETQIPEWLVSGMRVVVYTVGGRSVFTAEDYEVGVSTVKKVSRTSFTVKDDSEPRFRNSDQCSAHQGGGMRKWVRRVVKYDSPEGDYLMAVRNRNRYMDLARKAVRDWEKATRDQGKIHAVAEAFTAIPEPPTKPEGFR